MTASRRAGRIEPVTDGIEIADVRKRFAATSVLEGVTLSAPSGRLTALLGENGAGKSTLFKILMGLLEPDSGTATLDGADLLGCPLHAKAALGLGYLPQDSASFPDLSARDNLLGILELRIKGREDRTTRLAELLELVGLTNVAEHRYADMSIGEQRRLEIAKAVAISPRALLLDEPFSGLDPLIVEDLAALLTSLAAQDMAVLLTDHNVALTLAFADTIHLLAGGRIVFSGTPAEARASTDAKGLYFGRALEL